jgi:TRAP-type C4-dicarboxylate transport system substrate-binding protein
MAEHGFVGLGLASMGWWIILGRTPVRSMEDLRNGRFWTWSMDEMWSTQLEAMGIGTVRMPVEDGTQAWDEGKLDGFIALPNRGARLSMVGTNGSARTHYFSEISPGILPGCLVVAQRAFDQLSFAAPSATR